MKATETSLLKFMQGTRQFVIPIYQRTYSWTNTQCQQLWDDILRVGQDLRIPGHFVGSVVYIESGLYQISAVPQVLVIDGQQRLTTLTLLLAALGRVLEERNLTEEISRKKIENYYLYNAEEAGDLHYKLLLTQSDKETLLHKISDHIPAPAQEARRVKENYDFFIQQLRGDGVDPLAVYAGLSKLFIVDISLDRNYDNPQLIFESLNSTGLKLSQADLIRNYVLMGLEVNEQTRLYNTYWHPMEQRLSRAEIIPMFDRFMRDYLTIKSSTGAIPNIGDVYTSFKAYRDQHKDIPIAEIVADIYQFAPPFINLAYAKDTDNEITTVLEDINTLKVDVAYPFLMEVYNDYLVGVLSRSDFLAILRLVESYVFRRSVCGLLTNSLNKTFAQIRKGIEKSRYLDWVEAEFAGMTSYRRFPNDEEFKAAFVVKDMYNYRSRNYLLRKLENAGRKEPVKVDEYTIEHVMPQNANHSSIWQTELGSDWQRIHTDYLHRIGNLTLTGYNSELSDRSFAEKRTMPGGFDESPLRLNRSIAHLEHWNAEEIERRGRELAEKATSIWQAPQPKIKQRSANGQVEIARGARTYTIAEANYGRNLHGEVLAIFEQLRKRILNLDASVREEIKAQYVAYKSSTNFADVTPLKERLKISLNVAFDNIDDPRGICRNTTNLGHWGNGDVEISLSSHNELEYAMYLIEQAFEAQREDVE